MDQIGYGKMKDKRKSNNIFGENHIAFGNLWEIKQIHGQVDTGMHTCPTSVVGTQRAPNNPNKDVEGLEENILHLLWVVVAQWIHILVLADVET